MLANVLRSLLHFFKKSATMERAIINAPWHPPINRMYMDCPLIFMAANTSFVTLWDMSNIGSKKV